MARQTLPLTVWEPVPQSRSFIDSDDALFSPLGHTPQQQQQKPLPSVPLQPWPSRTLSPQVPIHAPSPSSRARSGSLTLPWRKRAGSVAASSEPSRDAPFPPVDPAAFHGGGLRHMMRRASVHLSHAFRRRSSVTYSVAMDDDEHPVQPRPETAYPAWHRLRQASSFRHPRTPHSNHGNCGAPGDYNATHKTDTDDPLPPLQFPTPTKDDSQAAFLDVPVPGSVGGGPPIIPHHTGAAAKASAALQNEYLASQNLADSVEIAVANAVANSLCCSRWVASDDGNDRESGIGIAAAGEGLGLESVTEEVSAQDPNISKVDFISQLPMELAVQILGCLDASTLATASRVSRQWHDIIQDQHIWRRSFLREKTTTFATSGPIKPGTGHGVPTILPTNDWKEIYRVRQELDKRWKAGKTTSVYLHGHKDSIYCLQFDEHKIITGSRDKTIRVWDMRTYKCKLVIGPPEVLEHPHLLYDEKNEPVHYALLATDRRSAFSVPTAVSFPERHDASILCLQYDDEILVTGSSDSTCIVHDVRDGYRPIRRLRFHMAAVLDLAFDQKHIVTCSKDYSICVWDRDTGAMLRQMRGHNGPVNAVQMRGNTIVSCSGDFRVKLWNVDTGKTIREFVGHTKGLACSQFSEDGRYVASAGNDKVIRVWDANTGECVREMLAHEGLVRSLHIDSVSGRLISGSYDTDIKVFDMETGDELLKFPRWHNSWVLSAKSDYRRIVSSGQDPKILILDFGADVPGVEMLESRKEGVGVGIPKAKSEAGAELS